MTAIEQPSDTLHSFHRFTGDFCAADVNTAFGIDVPRNQKKEKERLSLEQFLDSLKHTEFYIWHQKQHRSAYYGTGGKCCFNDIIGLPRKNGKPMPIFDYERDVFNALMMTDGTAKDKHLWVKKSTGLGISELILRWMLWLAVKDTRYSGTDMVVISGPRQDLATQLIARTKALIPEQYRAKLFDTKESILEINGVRISSYPSHHLDSVRGLPNVSVIFSDESDFYPKSEQMELRHIMERYIAKSSPYLIMVSTPQDPGGLFDQIEHEPEWKCIYRRLFLPYHVGLNKIYTELEIANAKKSPAFEREFNLKYLGELGNVFHIDDLDRAVELGKSVLYTMPDPNAPAKAMGIDPAWGGTSKFAICITQVHSRNRRIEVILADEYSSPRPSRLIEVCKELILRYYVDTIFVDSAAPEVVSMVKEAMDEDPVHENWEALLKKARSRPGALERDYMSVIPVSFDRKNGADMLINTQNILRHGALAINPIFKELIVQMRIARATVDGRLDKSRYSLDLLDALRLSLRHYDVKGLHFPSIENGPGISAIHG